MTLPNGELLLQNGKTLGNKEFKIYYKQKFHINKYEELQKAHKERNKEENIKDKKLEDICNDVPISKLKLSQEEIKIKEKEIEKKRKRKRKHIIKFTN